MELNKRAVSLILSLVGTAGVVSSIVLAVRNTPEAVNKIKADSRRNHDGNPYAYTNKEAICSGWKYYVTPTVIAAVTISCIWGLKSIGNVPSIGASGAYMLLNEVRKKVTTDSSNVENQKSDTQQIPENQTLFYDMFSERYFESTPYKVRTAEYLMNKRFSVTGEVEIDYFYAILNIQPDDKHLGYGWSISDYMENYGNDNLWLNFEHSISLSDDGLQCCIVSLPRPPKQNYK